MPTINPVPGLTLHYLEAGESYQPVILLLHGLGVTGESWQLQIPALVNAGLHVLAPDARGFGRSRYTGSSTGIYQMAGDMICLLDSLGISHAHVTGLSMGGTLALQMALDWPERVDRLVLANTFARLQPDRLNVWLYYALRLILVHTLGLPAQARTVARRLFPQPEQGELREILVKQILQADPRGYRAAMRALARFDVRRRLGEVQAPTLVVTGQHDNTVPVTIQSQLVSGIPNAHQVIIPGAGHAVSVEQSERFNQTLIDFLLH